MLSAYLTLCIILAGIAAFAHRKEHVCHREVLAQSLADTIPLLLRIPAAVLAGSFLAELIPKEHVVALLGASSGLWGVLLASALGGFLPGGPMIAFPLLLALSKAGMGLPQMIALLTAWLLLAFHRILAYELPMLGPDFVRRRLLACFPLPLLAGFMAHALSELF